MARFRLFIIKLITSRLAIKIFIAVFALTVLALLGYLLFWRPIVHTTNVVIDGDFLVGRRAVVMKGGATLTVKGNLTVDGDLRCQDGPLEVTVAGDLLLKDTIACQLPSSPSPAITTAPAPQGIALIVGGSAEFQPQSLVASNGHIQLVETAQDLLSEGGLDQVFDEISKDTGDEPRIGPLGGLGGEAAAPAGTETRHRPASSFNDLPTRILPGNLSIIEPVQAQDAPRRIIINGTLYVGSWHKPIPKVIDVKKLPKGVKRVVVRAYFPNGDVEFADKSVILSPDGQDGPDITGGCDINLPEQESAADKAARDAMRMRVEARNITIGELDLYLGDGGRGGHATTDNDCDPIGKAIAGHGGQSGNFKMSTAAGGALKIKGPFRIHPGASGDGGTATAYGKDGKSGEIGEKGRAAAAVGGNGADNIKVLRARGVADLGNIHIDSLIAGDGGDAIASPGDGGDSSKCDAKGGLPGPGGSSAGSGGKARLDYPPEVNDLPGAADIDGQDGKPIVDEAKSGKDGPPCAGKVPDKPSVTEPAPTDSSTKTPAKTPTDATPKPSTGGTTVTPPAQTPAKTEEKPLGYFEFLDAEYKRVVTLPSGAKVHIIVASTLGNPDMRTMMPIQLEFVVDGQVIWTGTIQGDPAVTCRGADGCSMDGPVINPAWLKMKLKATGKNGELLATYFQN